MEVEVEGITRAQLGVALQEISNSTELLGRLLTGERLVIDLARIPAMLEQAAQRLRRALCPADAPIGSKLNPGNHDCLNEALPDEPVFILLARDRRFSEHVVDWANRREIDIEADIQPKEDLFKTISALAIAEQGRKWREYRMGAWRK